MPPITIIIENGPTKIWLGTHAETTIEDQEGAYGDRASRRIKKGIIAKAERNEGAMLARC